MNGTINYGAPTSVPDDSGAAASGTSIAITETDLYVIKTNGQAYMRKSQLTIFIDVVLASAANVKFRYYVSNNGGTTWYAIPVKNLSSSLGELQDVPSIIDTGSPSQSVSGTTHYRTVEDISISGCNAFKVTGTATTAVSGAYVIDVWVRDN